MKFVALPLAVIALIGSSSVMASEELAKQKACLACHQVATKLVGPAYKDVAAKYRSDKDAESKLATKIRAGGVGVWGQVPMPANPAVSEAESKALAKWILAMK